MMRSNFISDNLVNIRDHLRENYAQQQSKREGDLPESAETNSLMSSTTTSQAPEEEKVPVDATVVLQSETASPQPSTASNPDARAEEAARLCDELRKRFAEEAQQMRNELKMPQYFLNFLEDSLKKLDAEAPLTFSEADALRVGYLHALSSKKRDNDLTFKETTGANANVGLRFIELPPGRMAVTVIAMSWPLMIVFLLGCALVAGAVFLSMG